MINLGEAEYAVALFMYMRLLGYPAHKISILTTYAGQRSLINDVLGHKCKNNPLFGRPKHVSTVDKYQGEQNDCKLLSYILEERHTIWTDANIMCVFADIILSLVRTRAIGYLRDIRRLTVALSRARLGLYVLGRRSVFESVFELKPAFDVLLQRPDKLTLVTDEMFGETRRSVEQGEGEEEVQGAVMEDVEHLGKYVYEMTKAKVEAIKANGGQMPSREITMGEAGVNGGVKGEDHDDDDDDDRPENVLVPEEVPEDFEDDDDDDDQVVV
jgi:intron-binding protein aquarius